MLSSTRRFQRQKLSLFSLLFKFKIAQPGGPDWNYANELHQDVIKWMSKHDY